MPIALLFAVQTVTGQQLSNQQRVLCQMYNPLESGMRKEASRYIDSKSNEQQSLQERELSPSGSKLSIDVRSRTI